MNKLKYKICQLCAVDFTLNNFLLPLIDAMIKEGWIVDSVCSYGGYGEKLKNKGYRIRNINIPRSINLIKIVVAIYQLYNLFKKEKYDIVHVHTPIASLIARIASKLAGVKLVIYTAHGFYFDENMIRIKFYFFLYLEKLFGYFTNILFLQSEEDAEIARKFKIVPKQNIYTIGNGVNIEKFNPFTIRNSEQLRRKLKIPTNAFVVGCIARLVQEKGLVEFLDAARSICKEYKEVYFVIIGERLITDHNSNITKNIIIAKKEFKNNIKFLGLRNDIPELISIMDLYCLPSWREGMPRSIIEAMMMGKPVIATNIRGSREEVVNGHTGIIVPIKSSLALKKGMIKFIQNKKLSIDYGKEGRKRALKLFDEKKIIDLQIKILKKYLKM